MTKQIKNIQVLGIDLATTKSVVCIIDETGKPKVVANADGESHTPSIVYYGRGLKEIVVGEAAANMLLLEPNRTFPEFKRDIGKDVVYLEEDSLKITPEECCVEVLKAIIGPAKNLMKDPNAVLQAVIAVPANFDDKQRQLVQHAGERAGLNVLRLINEPTAAALAYGLENTIGDNMAMILDWGGGTFDISIVQIQNGNIEVFFSFGDLYLGGKDIDERLMGLIQKEFQKKFKMDFTLEKFPAEWYQARANVIKEKHRLSQRQEVKLLANAQGNQVSVTVTRERFNKLIADLLERADGTISECLKQAKIDAKDIKKVVLVGGSSRIPAYQDMVKARFGADKVSYGKVSPDTAISEGAAIEAARFEAKQGVVMVTDAGEQIPAPVQTVKDCVTNSLGVLVQRNGLDKRFVSVILERGTGIPCQNCKSYASVKENQKKFEIKVVQGEQGQSEDEALVIAERTLILPPRSPDEKSIIVTFGYDESQRVHVFVEDLISKERWEITVNFTEKIGNQ